MSKTQKKTKAVAKTQTKAEEIVLIPIDKVIQHEFRIIGLVEETADKLKTEIERLAENMKEQGQLHPIIVRKKGDKFQVCTGGLRVAACKMNEWKHVKAVVRDLSDSEVLELNVAENMCRIDLTSIQRENLVCKLWQTGNYDSYRHLGSKIGLTGERVSNLMCAKELRDKIPPSPTTTANVTLVSSEVLIALKPLKNLNDQRKFIHQVQEGLIKPSDVREAVKDVMGWSRGAKEAVLNGVYPYRKAKVRIEDHMKQFGHWKREIEKRLENKSTFNKELKPKQPEEKKEVFRVLFNAVRNLEPDLVNGLKDKYDQRFAIDYAKFSTCLFIRLLYKLEVITEKQYTEILKMLGQKQDLIEGLKEDGGEMFFRGERGWEDRPKSVAALDKVELDSPETVVQTKKEG